VLNRKKHPNDNHGVPPVPADRSNASDRPGLPASPLAPQEIEQYRRALLARRAELNGDVKHLEDEALGRNRQEASGDLSKIPLHPADVGTDHYEQEFTLGLIQSRQEVLDEIDAALARIAAGTYGVCEATGRPIARARLRVQPWARFCIAHVRALERARGNGSSRAGRQ